MVDQRNLIHAAALNEEYRSINQALHAFEEGGKILAMMVGTPLPEGMEHRQPTGLMVRTDHMAYPAQMITGITAQLVARRDAIRNELREMGVTVPDRPPSPPGGGGGPPPEGLSAAQLAERRAARRAPPRQTPPRQAPQP